ncbi:MAG: hypothetical protein ACYC75_00635 [Minisyncoccota bacterium]
MGTIFTMLIVIIIAYALSSSGTPAANTSVGSSMQSASAVEGTATIPGSFSAAGTLVFYPNNVGPVPYIFYQDQSGRTAAKALVFPDGPPTNFSSWVGARVSVTGMLDAEHVVVSHIIYVSPP